MTRVLRLIGNVLRIFIFFLGLWKEKNDDKAKKKAEIGKDIVTAFAEIDKKTRAIRLNAAIGRIKRL